MWSSGFSGGGKAGVRQRGRGSSPVLLTPAFLSWAVSMEVNVTTLWVCPKYFITRFDYKEKGQVRKKKV